ncbi:hypothetical protein [Coxiella endosymbiont of Rhipicephalus microplus]|uniref:hypothetical protein n=1 Tax=Coxiella endosymbiont of Rhipicephalus microplus TaxID=1656186 RepID=UPI0013001674|nr:hypothetical protein [Coxiella endosymbiont of Rhipicephalus microplus]
MCALEIYIINLNGIYIAISDLSLLRTLPIILLNPGINNKELLNDPSYLDLSRAS